MGLLRAVYNATIRKHLPKVVGWHGDVPVRSFRLLDRTRYRRHKPAARAAISEYVEAGDHVVEIGSGLGVFAVVAARQGATVDSYDRDPAAVERARETVRLSDQQEAVNVHHADVGSGVAVADLPPCDVLLMDCEGAEVGILGQLTDPPTTVIVETHPDDGAPTPTVVERLESLGYDIVDERTLGRPDKYVVIARGRP